MKKLLIIVAIILLVYFLILKPQQAKEQAQAEANAEREREKEKLTETGNNNTTGAHTITTKSGIVWIYTAEQIRKIANAGGRIKTGFNSPMRSHYNDVTLYEDLGGTGKNRWTDAEIGKLMHDWRIANKRTLLSDARRQNWQAWITSSSKKQRIVAASKAFMSRLELVDRTYSIH